MIKGLAKKVETVKLLSSQDILKSTQELVQVLQPLYSMKLQTILAREWKYIQVSLLDFCLLYAQVSPHWDL